MPLSESETCELIAAYDPGDRHQRLDLVRELVAMANAEGGTIHVGARENGERPGVDAATAAHLDPARIQDLVDEFTRPDSIRIDCSSEAADDPGRHVILIRVLAVDTYPLVFTRSGEFKDAGGETKCAFARHSVYRRRGTKAEPARREDFRKWVNDAALRENESWKSRVAVLQNLPPGSTVEVVMPEDTLDEPSALLRRATRMFKRNPERLLMPQELIEVFLVRRQLTLHPGAIELLIHSALRKRSTLFFWLDVASPSAELISRLLDEAIEASDRDKSDAGPSIAILAALYLRDDEFERVIKRLGESTYAHFCEAAADTPDRETATSKLVANRDRNLDGTPLSAWPEPDLVAAADEIARPMMSRTGHTVSRSRRLSRIGIELFLRHHRQDLLS